MRLRNQPGTCNSKQARRMPLRNKAGAGNGRIGSVRVGCLLPAAFRHMDGAETAGLIMDVR